jgi:subtilisin-like proprotein convertase family protein
MTSYKYVLLISSLLFFQSQLLSQSTDKAIWTDIFPASVEHNQERTYSPDRFRTLNVDFEVLKAQLSKAPMENSHEAQERQVTFSIPDPDGKEELFRIIESPVMHPDLAAQFPMIKTFSAQSIVNPSRTARLDFTEWGFHAMIISADGWYFIEPFYQGNVNDYICYYKRDSRQRAPFECDFVDHMDDYRSQSGTSGPMARTSGSQLKTYRLALACTGEYAAFHGGTVSGALSAMTTSVNRVNGVYELEVAVRMVLIANTNLLIYTNAGTDPYTNSSGSTMLGENISNINSVIGSANYDIGHVFSTGGGGVAYLGSVCGSNKAGGVTGQSSPVGDNFDIDYVAHEMGHQFGGSHTFNSVTGSCSGNRSSAAAMEPGSGTTIMAYAGICGADNIQPHSDPIFHTYSYDQIQVFITTGNGNSCDVQTSTGNTPPVINAGPNYTIPYLTPFTLVGSATDVNGDNLTYLWEEYDIGNAGSPNSPSGNAPIFRVFTPITSPARTFPRIEDLVRNQQTLGEILPSYARTLQFKFTARDNRLFGGGVSNNNTPVQLTVINTGSAFEVTSPNTNVTWTGLTSQTVTWNVSSTDVSPINCANVNILLSVDSGYTFPYILAANTPNDGSQTVSVPNIPGNKNRVKVESVGNVFFDISNVNFTIVAGSGVLTAISTSSLVSNNLCAGSVVDVSFVGNGIPNSGNNYYAQLSNASGSFVSGVVNIGSLLNTTVSSGTISCTIPGGTASGSLYRVRVISTNPAVNGTDNGSDITISQIPGTPGSISGSATVCQSQTSVVYTVPVITNATGYNWSLPSGATITGGSNTSSITVSFSGSAVSGSITVSGTNTACGSGPVSPAFFVTVNPIPVAAGLISGPASVCQSTNSHTYSVPTINFASSYSWTLPSGASISSGSGTSSITVSFSGAALSGNISVYGVNSCGVGIASVLAIDVESSPAVTTVSAGGPVDLCSGSDVILSFTPVGGIDYQWRKNSIDIFGETFSSYTASTSGIYDVTAVQSPVAPQSFTNTNSYSIPDNSCTGASSTISVTGYAAAVNSSGISIQLNIIHTYLGDLVLMLEAPDGSRLGLSNRVGGSADNYVNTIFSDAGAVQIPSSGAPYTGTYKPWTSIFTQCVTTNVTTFSAIGSGSFNPNGDWKLWVYDRAGLDLGTLVNWTLNLPGSSSGTCFSESNTIIVTEIPPVTISGFNPSSGASGTNVILSGGDFTGTTGVTFNGVTAAYSVDNPSQITATVPVGATTGLISVTGPCGTVYSGTIFTVGSSDLDLHLTVLIEGFYRGGGQMTGTISPSVCDTIEVSLADPNPPHALLYTVKGTIDLTGTGDFNFVGAGQSEYYYLVVKHRNALEIWSADSVSFYIPSINYNFSNLAAKAHGANQISVGGGKFAMYSGDINQDGVINDNDVSMFESGMQSFLYGYYPHDLTGDSMIEAADFSLLENNATVTTTVSKP